MTARRFLLTFAIVLMCLAASFQVVAWQAAGLVLDRLVDESAFLNRSTRSSCLLLSARRPAVVTAGDSHAEAAWNLSLAQSLLGTVRLGGCNIPGMYMNSIPEVVDLVGTVNRRPLVMLLGVSPRMLWKPDTYDRTAATIGELLRSATDPKVVWGDVLWRGLLVSPWSRSAYLNNLGLFGPLHAAVEAIDPRKVDSILNLASRSAPTLTRWHDRIENYPINEAAFGEAEAVCARARQNGLTLVTLHIPESPWLEAQYTPVLRQAYDRLLGILGGCSRRVIKDNAEAYGLDNRHFLPGSPQEIAGWERTAAEATFKFDSDHVNAVGAQIFTKAVIGKIRPDLEAWLR